MNLKKKIWDFFFYEVKCSKCNRPYNDFILNFDDSTITCVGCHNKHDLVEELGKKEAVLMLETFLKKGSPDNEESKKVEKLIERIKSS